MTGTLNVLPGMSWENAQSLTGPGWQITVLEAVVLSVSKFIHRNLYTKIFHSKQLDFGVLIRDRIVIVRSWFTCGSKISTTWLFNYFALWLVGKTRAILSTNEKAKPKPIVTSSFWLAKSIALFSVLRHSIEGTLLKEVDCSICCQRYRAPVGLLRKKLIGGWLDVELSLSVVLPRLVEFIADSCNRLQRFLFYVGFSLA